MVNNTLLTEAKKLSLYPSYIINAYDLCFEWMDQSVLKILDYTKDEIANLEHSDLLIFDDECPELDFYEKITLQESTLDLKIKAKNGQVSLSTVTFKTFTYNDEPHIVACITNLTSQ